MSYTERWIEEVGRVPKYPIETPIERVEAFLDERSKSTNFDPEDIVGYNDYVLHASDLRELLKLIRLGQAAALIPGAPGGDALG